MLGLLPVSLAFITELRILQESMKLLNIYA